MQLFFPPAGMAVALCFLVWPLIQVGAAILCLKLPDRLYDPSSPFFRAHRWEDDGELYRRVCKVDRWKRYLPDGGAIMKGGYRKRRLMGISDDELHTFLVESCRAELTHWLAMGGLVVFFLFVPPAAVLLMVPYALVVNLPCIITQRYNRPRITRLLAKRMLAQEGR